MTREDYAAVGFKSGLEIHQQLLTEKKLFCRCPAGRYSDIYHAEILRHMRPTLSELGPTAFGYLFGSSGIHVVDKIEDRLGVVKRRASRSSHSL